MKNSKNICVYCSSSNSIDPVFFKAANELATAIVKRGHTLVYGGGCVGLMGELARTVHHHQGKVIGVISEGIRNKGVCYEQSDELIITRDMRERKHIMDTRSDAFITLPGGFGTLEEVSEMITSKQLGFHNKPLVILNVNNFYAPLIEFFEHIYNYGFSKAVFRDLYYLTPDIESCISYIENYTPFDQISKFS